MAQSEDTEITLGTGKLLVLFFGLVAVCALFFALGYSLGRRSDVPALAARTTVQAAPASRPTAVKSGQGTSAQPPMTFYKAVEQKDASPQLTPASAEAGSNAATASDAAKAQPEQTAGGTDPVAAPVSTGYYVQVAAVTKSDDAEALVEALKKKQYPAFVATNSALDKLSRVQVGPFADSKAAEAMRARLINDGYNPIVKK
jgi:cell division septation protein DedD